MSGGDMSGGLHEAIVRLRRSAGIIARLAEEPPVDPTWRPDPARWSFIEVIGHLLCEEREDFRPRLDLLLHEPETPWAPIDPEGRVEELDFRARSLDAVVAEFAQERERSLQWLASLDVAPLERERTHPRGFVLRGGDLLASWVAHDLLHIRQLIGLEFAGVEAEWAEFSTLYAGEWSSAEGE